MNLKKLLSTIGIISATLTGSLNIVACNNSKSDSNSTEKKEKSIKKNKDETKKSENDLKEANKMIESAITESKDIAQIEENKSDNQEEINALNTIKQSNFSITVPKGTEAGTLYNLINGEFITSELSDNLKNTLNLSEFKLEDISIKKEDLIKQKEWLFEIKTKDLNMESTLTTIINFSYKDKKIEVPLTINIISQKEILDKDIAQITNNFIVLKNKEKIKTNTDGRINILSDTAIAKYIAESVRYIDFHIEPNHSDIIATSKIDDIRKIIKINMRKYFAENDKSLIKNIFNPKDLKIGPLYIIKDGEMKRLSEKDLEKTQEIIVGLKYKNVIKYSNYIILNSINTVLRDEKDGESTFYLP